MTLVLDRTEITSLGWGGLILRTIGVGDKLALNTALADTHREDGEHFTGLGDPQVGAEAWLAWRAAETRKGRCVSLACFDAESNLLGEVALSDLDILGGHANLSYWIRLSARRRGVGLAIAASLCRYGFASLGLRSINIMVSAQNVASYRIAQALGAKLGDLVPSICQSTFLLYDNNAEHV